MSEESPWKGSSPGGEVKVSFWFMVVLAVASLFIALQSGMDGDVFGALGLGAGTVFLGHLIGFSVTLWWRPRRSEPSPSSSDGSVTFRYSGWTYYWVASFTVLMILVLLLLGLGFLVAGDPTSIAVALAAFASAAFFCWGLVRLFYGGRGWLRLTPGGLEHHGAGFNHRISWDAVADVGAATIDNGAPLIIVLPMASAPVDVTFALPRLLGKPRIHLLPSMAIRGWWLADDPVVVYRTLRHHHVNPGHRTELSTPAAVDRIRQGRFLAR